MKRKINKSKLVNSPRDTESVNITSCLNRIMLRVSSGGYDNEAIEFLKRDLDYVCDKLNICIEEAVLLSSVLENSTGFSGCDDEDLANFMGCTNIEFLKYKKYLDSLSRKRIVRISKRDMGNASYKILNSAYDAIIEDRHFSETDFSGLTTEDMFSEFRKLFKARRSQEIDNEMLLYDLNMLIDMNPQNKFVEKYKTCGIRECSPSEQRVFIYLCHQYVSWGKKSILYHHFIDFVSDNEDEQKFFRLFQAGKHKFQKKSLVRFGGDEGFMDKGMAALSENVTESFFSEVELFSEDVVEGHHDLTNFENITERQLFYNSAEEQQVKQLEELLIDEHFCGIQTRLEEMGMRKGFNIILYGAPGTGKTETTLQLARKTKRDVLSIDVSNIKSKWVGDSEKAIKGVFRTYKQLCKKKGCKPILFFNEADAIFGKRMETVDTPVAQMLNSMQNIILQEMETLDGIMISTTNLHANLDPAFERRFIYKLELEKPGSEVRTKIWKSMLPCLAEEDYSELGKRYNFSGGQIENVVRKSTVDYILTGNNPTMDVICKFSEEEMFKSKVKKVGF